MKPDITITDLRLINRNELRLHVSQGELTTTCDTCQGVFPLSELHSPDFKTFTCGDCLDDDPDWLR